MAPLAVYGIKNCDTMKKAFAWLESHGIAYDFHDYKKQPAPATLLKRAIDEQGWENVLNRKGTTWRNLPDAVKESMDAAAALQLALDNPSIIRRPMIVQGDDIAFGFDAEAFAARYR